MDSNVYWISHFEQTANPKKPKKKKRTKLPNRKANLKLSSLDIQHNQQIQSQNFNKIASTIQSLIPQEEEYHSMSCKFYPTINIRMGGFNTSLCFLLFAVVVVPKVFSVREVTTDLAVAMLF
jgi:hypothetical protein